LNSNRRTLLKWSLGASQLGLLERFNLLGSRPARAQTSDVPSRLVMIYIPGGFRPHYAFCPVTEGEVPKVIPVPLNSFNGEPCFFGASKLIDLAAANGNYAPLRVFQSWNQNQPSMRNDTFTPAMYGYVHFKLHENVAVLHGIDQGTADHQSAYVSAMCGVASPDYRAPSMHAVVANHLFERTKDQRPLPFVAVSGDRGIPQATGLPSHAAPVKVPSIEGLKPQLSTKPADNGWWKGLDARAAQPETTWDLTSKAGQLSPNLIERFALKQPARFKQKSTGAVDGFLEQLHGSLSSVSRLLATDVVGVLNNTKGFEYLAASRPNYLSSYLQNEIMTYTFGLANFNLTGLDARFDLALRMMKADLTSSIHVSFSKDFDTHNGTGHSFSAAHGRNHFELVARFLGEMKLTPCPGKPGKSLLDDSLVVVCSEFGRTWARQTSAETYELGDDHHPVTSMLFAGGNVAPNRTVGGYDIRGFGTEVGIREEDGSQRTRKPRSADAVASALSIMGLGLNDFFIPGGYGEVVGLRKNG
jgi:Protein of unknown function (DUF1501)